MQQNDTNDYIIYAIIICCLLAACLWLLGKYASQLHAVMMAVARAELYPVSLFSAEAEYVRSAIASLDPETVTTSEALAQLEYAGRWYALASAAAVLVLGIRSWKMSASDNFRRSFSMRSLLENNRGTHSCVAPVLSWPKSILDEPADSGPWMVARQPLQFVADNGLFISEKDAPGLAKGDPVPGRMLLGDDNLADPYSPVLSESPPVSFDRERCFAVFKEQFGPPHTGFGGMPRYLQKLALAFLLFGAENKKDAYALLDSLSLSFRPPEPEKPGRWDWRKFPFCYTRAGKALPYRLDLSMGGYSSADIAGLLGRKDVARLVRAHDKYRNLFILALYEYARAKGVLPTAEFIWLRPVNRRLFYLLNNFGRRSAWTEIAGPWAWYLAEEQLALSPGFPGSNAIGDDDGDYREMVKEAVNALEYNMYEEGWIPRRFLSDDATAGRIVSD